MREILFRGKRKDNGNFIEGFFIFDGFDHYIVKFYADENAEGTLYPVQESFEVIPGTEGQFTGRTDKNGKRIFEGDIVKQTFEKTVATMAIDWGADEYADLYGEDVGAVVIIPSKGVCIKHPVIHREVNGETTQHGERARMYKTVCSGRCEIIGNIHDNPELLEVSE